MWHSGYLSIYIVIAMNRELIISVNPTEVSIALCEDKVLVELNKEQCQTGFAVGDIYLGRVRKIMPGLNAAFVNIGHEKDAFIHYLDLGENYASLQRVVDSRDANKRPVKVETMKLEPKLEKEGRIGDHLKVGDTVMVQIAKEAISTKGPRLTADISLAGRNVVLVPFSNKVYVSTKIRSNAANKRLRKVAQDVLPQNFGVIVRTAAADAEDSEAARLDAISEKIREVGEKAELTIEMGRFFAAPCGYYVNKVIDTKTCEGIHYAILDGGLNQLKYDGQIQGMQIPNITHIPASAAECGELPWTLCGSLCTTADVLARNVAMKNLQIGDTLVFERTGAYSVSEGMALFLSRELPEVNVYSAEAGLIQLRPLMDASCFNTPFNMDLFGRAAL